MATKQEMGEIVQILKDQINYLKSELVKAREEKETLQKQIVRLTDGIMSIRSPMAYQDMRSDVLGTPAETLTPEEKSRAETRKRIQDTFIRSMEEDTFKTPEEIDDLLEGALRKGAGKTKSLHGNSES